MHTRLSSRRFVGRVGELAELELAVREAGRGRPTLVLLGGDSGVGKTRLVQELRARLSAAEAPPLILSGDAVPPAEGELPYAPLIGALRPLVRDGDPVFGALHPSTRAELAALLPGLDAGREEAQTAAARSAGGDAAGQLRLFEALLALLDAVSEREPVLLALEDLHWADGSTRALVAFLARSLRTERVTVLATYRSDELHRRHPLRPLLAELGRLERTRTLELEPFDRDELSEALADILGAAPEEPLIERLHARTEGNPLYTEELLAAGLDGRGAPPRSLSDAFLRRIERLSADAQRVTRALALGRALDEPALAAVTGLENDAIALALREALGEQVVVARGERAFGFRHALLREALYDDLLPGERGALHAALAAHLEAEREHTADEEERTALILAVAFHQLAAGDQPAALRASVIAAEAAVRTQAMGEAAELYERALELWPRVPAPESLAGLDHVELLCRAAAALSIVDRRGRADSLLCRALDELDPDADPARYALVLARHGRALWSLNRGDEAIAAGERALTLIGAEDPRGERARIRGWLARRQFLRGRFREAAIEAEAALAGARALGDELAETELLNTRGMVQAARGEIEPGIASLREAIALARRREDPDSLGTAAANLADTLVFAGRLEEAASVVRDGLAGVPESHLRTREWLTLVGSEVAFHAGDWTLAQAFLSPQWERMNGLLFMFHGLREAELAAGIGDDARAQAALDAVGELVADSIEPQWIGVHGALAATLTARRGDLDGARAAVARALDRMEVCTDDIARIALVSHAGMGVEADRAQRARDLGDAAGRRDALVRARLHLDRIDAAAQDGGPWEHARLLHAKAELARARGRAAAAAWERAAHAWEALGTPYPAALARWREAECRLRASDRDGAGVAARAALRGARSLGSGWLEREVRSLAQRGRLALLQTARPLAEGDADADADADAAPRASEDPFGLTDRERQVLSLVAQGATNRQIGAALYMAEKTASVHVSRILAKLDVRGRTEAAAVAHRLHLA